MYLLKIGHLRFLLPNNRGVSTVMDVLAKSHLVKDFEYDARLDRSCHYASLQVEGPPAVEMEALPGMAFRKRADRAEAIDPDEVLPPVRGHLASGTRRIAAGASRMIDGGVA